MKKIFILLFILSSFSIFSQSIDNLIIPSDYATLKAKYIELATMYIDTKKDLNTTLASLKDTKDQLKIAITNSDESNKTITTIIEKYNESIGSNTDLVKSSNELIEQLEKSTKIIKSNTYDFFRFGVGMEYSYSIADNINKYSISGSCLVANKFFISTKVSYPIEIGIGAGFYIN